MSCKPSNKKNSYAKEEHRSARSNSKESRPQGPQSRKKKKGTPYNDSTDYGVSENVSNIKNDISWYSKNPNLLVAAGSFPFPNRPGMTIPLSASNPSSSRFDLPGVLACNWIPSLGKSNNPTDPASVLGKEIYARVRQAYSGSLDADAPDYVMYLMALDSIFAYIAWLKRIYRALVSWNPNNYAVPTVLLHAMGLTDTTINNLTTKRTRLWQCINELVLNSRKFSAPGSMDIFNRHYWMSDNVYADANSANSQLYIFNLVGVYKFSTTLQESGASGLEMISAPGAGGTTNYSVEDLYNFGLQLIDALVAWDDAYTINGYLRRAFEGEPEFMLSELELNEQLAPVYSEEVLAQIENSRACIGGSYLTALSGFNVTQNVTTNAVISNPHFTLASSSDIAVGTMLSGFNVCDILPTLTIRSDTPNVVDNVIASRLQNYSKVTKISDSDTYNVEIVCATEVVLVWQLFDNARVGTKELPVELLVQQAVHSYYGSVTTSAVSTAMAKAQFLQDVVNLKVGNFDWHPLSYVNMRYYESNAQGSVATYVEQVVNGDVHNLTTISVEDLRNLHKICMYSEFNSFGLYK